MTIRSLSERARRGRPALVLAGILSLVSCGDDKSEESGVDQSDGGQSSGDGDQSSGGNGTVTAEWADFCTALFTRDTPIRNGSTEEVLFTPKAGEKYLLGEETDLSSRAEFLYLTSGRPDPLYLRLDAVGGSWPFTTNCEAETVVYYAAFADVTVFAEDTLTTKLCDIKKGTVLLAGDGRRGHEITSQAVFDPTNPVYKLFLDVFGPQCGGAESGFARIPETTSFGGPGNRTPLVPLVGIIGPK